MDKDGLPVGLTDAQRRERAAELRRVQEEKERKMRELQAEFQGDRSLARTCVRSTRAAGAAGQVPCAAAGTAPSPATHAAGEGGVRSPGEGEVRSPALSAAEARAASAAARAASAAPAPAPAPATATKRARMPEPPSLPRPEFQQGGISAEERKRRAEEIKRQQAERERARREIASEFRADHSFRASSRASESDAPASVPAPDQGARPGVVVSQVCLVQLRMPSGEVTQKEFGASDLLAMVVDWAQLVLRQVRMR